MGFVFPTINCEYKSLLPFDNNEVGVSAQVGVIYHHDGGS